MNEKPINQETVQNEVTQEKPVAEVNFRDVKKDEKKLRLGTRVIVKTVDDIPSLMVEDKRKFIGATGIIVDKGYSKVIDANEKLYQYNIKFDDSQLDVSNTCDGDWLFAEEELQVLKRIEVGHDYKLIVNYPAVIFILIIGDKSYKGVAVKMENDEWDEAKGIEIARLKAWQKAIKARLKELSR